MQQSRFWTDSDAATLILRITLAINLFLNGWPKLVEGVEGQMGLLAANGIPGVFMYFVYVSEIVAPVLLVLGRFTRLSAVSVIITMVVVFYVLPVPFFGLNQFGGWNKEGQFFFLAVGVALFFTGAGRYRISDMSNRHWLLD